MSQPPNNSRATRSAEYTPITPVMGSSFRISVGSAAAIGGAWHADGSDFGPSFGMIARRYLLNALAPLVRFGSHRPEIVTNAITSGQGDCPWPFLL